VGASTSSSRVSEWWWWACVYGILGSRIGRECAQAAWRLNVWCWGVTPGSRVLHGVGWPAAALCTPRGASRVFVMWLSPACGVDCMAGCRHSGAGAQGRLVLMANIDCGFVDLSCACLLSLFELVLPLWRQLWVVVSPLEGSWDMLPACLCG